MYYIPVSEKSFEPDQQMWSYIACMFNCPEAEDIVLNRKRKFLINYASLDNLICSVCHTFANPETAAISVVYPA